MTQADFIAKHGPCQPEPKLNAFFRASCVRPLLVAGSWKTGQLGALPILDGQFTTWGYFAAGQRPDRLALPWQALDAALGLARTWAERLAAAGCRGASGSEGDAPYFPFVQSRPRTGHKWSLKSIVRPLDAPLRQALVSGELVLQYGSTVQFLDLADQQCLFMADPEDDEPADGTPETAALQAVSAEMRQRLHLICEAHLFSSFGEFPVLYIGEDSADQLVGLITTSVWT